MAPLSKDTSGIILPFDTFGSHLNTSNKTIDAILEEINFKSAGEILAEVWSKTVIDNYPVVAQYQPPGKKVEFDGFTQQWIDSHVRQSRYLLQVVKCKDLTCCKTSRTNYEEMLGSRFLPAPIPVKVMKKGPTIHSEGEFGSIYQSLACIKNQNKDF